MDEALDHRSLTHNGQTEFDSQILRRLRLRMTFAGDTDDSRLTMHYLPPLASEFYNRHTLEVAPALLGKVLYHRAPEGITSGVIVETEAYLCDDPACHASRGMTERNSPMFGPPGRAYVYFTYGMHFCMNVVTSPEGVGEAVLIRALEPIEGIELMARRRGMDKPTLLCSGPARLTQAMAVGREQNRADLSVGDFLLLDAPPRDLEIIAAPRIGIRQGAEHLWRFYMKDSQYVSRGSKPSP